MLILLFKVFKKLKSILQTIISPMSPKQMKLIFIAILVLNIVGFFHRKVLTMMATLVLNYVLKILTLPKLKAHRH